MLRAAKSRLSILLMLALSAMLLAGCQPEKTEAVRPVKIADGEMDPAAWGKAYPVHYDLRNNFV